MTPHFGEVFKKIRTGKKMSLKDVSGDYLSISFISKFERGESEITLSRFLILLQNLNVSINEFYKLSTSDIPNEDDLLISKVSSAYYNNNLPALKKYQDEELLRYQDTDSKKYLYNSIMIEAFISSVEGTKISENSSKLLSDYLFGIDYWGKYELMILGNSMSALPIPTLSLLVNELTEKTRLFGDIDENYLAKINLLLNAVYTCIEANELIYAKKYLDHLSDLTIPDRLLYEKFEMQFALGLYHIKAGKVEMGRDIIENLLSVLKIVGSEQLMISRESAYKQILDSYI